MSKNAEQQKTNSDEPKSPEVLEQQSMSEKSAFTALFAIGRRHGPFTHVLGEEMTSEATLVNFEGPDDNYRAVNWPSGKKNLTVILCTLLASGVAFNSAILASANARVASESGVSDVVVSLSTTMILLGIAFGPLLWAPLSELYRHRWVNIAPYFLSAFFAFGCGASANIQTILVTRFFQGVLSGGIMANTGGVLADLYVAKERGNALIVYSLSVIGGPFLAPIVGSAIITSHMRWRWIMDLFGIFQTAISVIAALVVEVSYSPVLLQEKKKLRN